MTAETVYSNMPPGCEIRGGKLVRVIPREATDGSAWDQVREVASNLKEAKMNRTDFYSNEFGWIREGYKLEKDRETEHIMADTSVPISEGLTPSGLPDLKEE